MIEYKNAIADGDIFFSLTKYLATTYNAISVVQIRNDDFNLRAIREKILEIAEPWKDLHIIHVVPHTTKVSIYRYKDIWFAFSEEDFNKKNLTSFAVISMYYVPNEECADIVYNLCKENEVVKKKHNINIVVQGTYGLNITEINYDTCVVVDTDAHYNDDFKEQYDKVLELTNQNKSGLVLWHGDPGTGKTTAIQKLLSESERTFIFLPASLAHYLGEPTFNTLLLGYKNSVLIIEDAESLLEKQLRRSPAVSNLLNITDGMLKHLFNCLILCTFNTHLSAIDNALLRGGRLLSKYEFKPLAEAKVKAINPELTGSLTLAEIFCEQVYVEPKATMGFKN